MDHESTIKHLVLQNLHWCVVCHRPHDISDIEVLKRGDDFWTMLVECPDCHARNFVAAMVNETSSSDSIKHLTEDAVAMATDFFRELQDDPTAEQVSVTTGERVTASDVVDVHQFLEEFDGDFQSLFRK